MVQLELWWKSWVPDSILSAGCVVARWGLSTLLRLISGGVESDVHLFVAGVVKFFDVVDRGVLDCVLSSLGLLGWFRHA